MMEKQLNLVSNLSLKEMAFRRVAVILWSDSFIFALMQKIRFFDIGTFSLSTDPCQDIIDRLQEKVSKLELPESLKEKMLRLVIPFGNEILKWKMFHKCLLRLPRKYPFTHILEQLCWTCTGAVDYKETAKALVRLEMLDIAERYRLACYYCLEDYIPALWKELPEMYKRNLNVKVSPLSDNVVYLECYWASFLKGEEFELNSLPTEFVNESSSYESLFKYSSFRGSKAATEFFFQKLTVEERDSALFKTVCDVLEKDARLHRMFGRNERLRSDTFYYLLLLLTHEQLMQVLEKHSSSCLMFFVDWPWQDFCLDTADFVWNFINENHYDSVLNSLQRKLLSTYFYFPDIFQKFFTRSPISFRKRYLECEFQFGFLPSFCRFFIAEDLKTIKIILENLDSGDRMRFLSNQHFLVYLDSFVSDEKWHFVDMCIGKAMLSNEDRQMLKQVYMGFFKEGCKDFKFKRLFEMLDGTSASTSSTKYLDDEMPTKANRLSEEEKKYDLSKKLKRQ